MHANPFGMGETLGLREDGAFSSLSTEMNDGIQCPILHDESYKKGLPLGKPEEHLKNSLQGWR